MHLAPLALLHTGLTRTDRHDEAPTAPGDFLAAMAEVLGEESEAGLAPDGREDAVAESGEAEVEPEGDESEAEAAEAHLPQDDGIAAVVISAPGPPDKAPAEAEPAVRQMSHGLTADAVSGTRNLPERPTPMRPEPGRIADLRPQTAERRPQSAPPMTKSGPAPSVPATLVTQRQVNPVERPPTETDSRDHSVNLIGSGKTGSRGGTGPGIAKEPLYSASGEPRGQAVPKPKITLHRSARGPVQAVVTVPEQAAKVAAQTTWGEAQPVRDIPQEYLRNSTDQPVARVRHVARPSDPAQSRESQIADSKAESAEPKSARRMSAATPPVQPEPPHKVATPTAPVATRKPAILRPSHIAQPSTAQAKAPGPDPRTRPVPPTRTDVSPPPSQVLDRGGLHRAAADSSAPADQHRHQGPSVESAPLKRAEAPDRQTPQGPRPNLAPTPPKRTQPLAPAADSAHSTRSSLAMSSAEPAPQRIANPRESEPVFPPLSPARTPRFTAPLGLAREPLPRRDPPRAETSHAVARPVHRAGGLPLAPPDAIESQIPATPPKAISRTAFRIAPEAITPPKLASMEATEVGVAPERVPAARIMTTSANPIKAAAAESEVLPPIQTRPAAGQAAPKPGSGMAQPPNATAQPPEAKPEAEATPDLGRRPMTNPPDVAPAPDSRQRSASVPQVKALITSPASPAPIVKDPDRPGPQASPPETAPRRSSGPDTAKPMASGSPRPAPAPSGGPTPRSIRANPQAAATRPAQVPTATPDSGMASRADPVMPKAASTPPRQAHALDQPAGGHRQTAPWPVTPPLQATAPVPNPVPTQTRATPGSMAPPRADSDDTDPRPVDRAEPGLTPVAPRRAPALPGWVATIPRGAAGLAPPLVRAPARMSLTGPEDASDDAEPLLAAGLHTATPGGASAATPITPAPGPRPMAEQVVAALRSSTDRPLEVDLHPRELGRLRIAVTHGEAGMILTLTAERAETIDLMRRHAGDLQTALREAGLGDVGLAFGQGGKQSDPQRQEDGAPPDPGPRRAPITDSRPPDPASAPRLRRSPDGLDIRL